MVEYSYNYLDSSIQNISKFFETGIKNLESMTTKKNLIRTRNLSPTRKGNIQARKFPQQKEQKEAKSFADIIVCAVII